MHGVQQEAATHAAPSSEEVTRLPWPAAALAIAALSLAGWAAFGVLVRLFLG